MSALEFRVDWNEVDTRYNAITVEGHVAVGWARLPRYDEQKRTWTTTDSRFEPKPLWTLPDFFEIEVKESLCVRPAPPRFYTAGNHLIYDEISGPVAVVDVSEKAMETILAILNRVVREGRE